ncbi:hypothetical protein ABBQ38_014164 [Trebouxia sp. C0009 RCD-2024]
MDLHVPLITVNTVCLQQMNSCNTFMAQTSTAACKGSASSKAAKCTGSFENTTTAGTAALSAARTFHTDKLLPTSTPGGGRSRILADVTPSTLSPAADHQRVGAARKVRGADSVFIQDSQ